MPRYTLSPSQTARYLVHERDRSLVMQANLHGEKGREERTRTEHLAYQATHAMVGTIYFRHRIDLAVAIEMRPGIGAAHMEHAAVCKRDPRLRPGRIDLPGGVLDHSGGCSTATRS